MMHIMIQIKSTAIVFMIAYEKYFLLLIKMKKAMQNAT